MRVSHEMVKRACARRGISLQTLLQAAGVSTNAYYSLAGKKSALPKSISRIAEVLNLPVSRLLVDEQALLEDHLDLLAKVDQVAVGNEQLDRDTIRHTLILLKEPPIDRLRRALRLGSIRHTG